MGRGAETFRELPQRRRAREMGNRLYCRYLAAFFLDMIFFFKYVCCNYTNSSLLIKLCVLSSFGSSVGSGFEQCFCSFCAVLAAVLKAVL